MLALFNSEHYDALGLAELLQTKQVTPAELVGAAIRGTELHNRAFNAVIYIVYDQARAVTCCSLPAGPVRCSRRTGGWGTVLPLPPAGSFLKQVTVDPGTLRIAFSSHPLMGSWVHQDCLQGRETTVGLLQDLGHTVIEATPQVDGEALAEAFLKVVCSEGGSPRCVCRVLANANATGV